MAEHCFLSGSLESRGSELADLIDQAHVCRDALGPDPTVCHTIQHSSNLALVILNHSIEQHIHPS